MTAAGRFIRLPWPERRLAIRAAIALLAVKAGLMTVGFAAVRRRTASAGEIARVRPDLKPSSLSPERIARLVQAASCSIPGASNCLVQALATEYLLGRFGYPSELKIGVRRNDGGELAAHAWLESEGTVVIGDFELDRYVPLSSAAGRAGIKPQ